MMLNADKKSAGKEEQYPGLHRRVLATHLIMAIVCIALCQVCICTSAKPACAADQTYGPVSVESALKQKWVEHRSQLALSPDGQWVAYTVKGTSTRHTESDRLYKDYSRTGTYSEAVGCNVWVTNVTSKVTKKLGTPTSSNWAPVWSPDGKFLAFYSDRDGLAKLWLWELATNRFRLLADEIVRPYFNFQAVRFSPDGQKLLVKVLAKNMTIEQAARTFADLDNDTAKNSTNDKTENLTASAIVLENIPKSTPAGQATDSSPAPAKTVSNLHVGIETAAWNNRYSADLAIVDVATGKVERTAKHVRPCGDWISPDGKYVVYTDFQGIRPNTQSLVFRLVLVNLADKSSRVLVPALEQDYGNSVSWSPDSSSIAYISRDSGNDCKCHVVDIVSAEQKNWTPVKENFMDMWTGSSYRPPLWDPSSKCLYLISSDSKDGSSTNAIWKASASSCQMLAKIPQKKILEIAANSSSHQIWTTAKSACLFVSVRDEKTKQAGFWKIDLSNGEATKVFEENARLSTLCFEMDGSKSGQTIAYLRESVEEPGDIWVAGVDFGDRKRVSEVNPEISRTALGKSRLLEYRSQEGAELCGAILLPANYKEGQRYPLVVNVYGGSDLSSRLNSYGLGGTGVEDMQLLASRGYAVLLPDVPVKKGSPMKDILKAVLPAIDRVIDLGIADPERIGIMGHSYGGYSTLALIVQTNRFRAAVASACISDMFSAYGSLSPSGSSNIIGWCENGQGGMEGTPWQYRERYIENSPVFFLDRVKTPLLLIQGALDPMFYHQQADEVFVGLRRLDKEVAYAKYEGEGHWPGSWGFANQVDYLNRVLSYLDKHLKGTDTIAEHGKVPTRDTVAERDAGTKQTAVDK